MALDTTFRVAGYAAFALIAADAGGIALGTADPQQRLRAVILLAVIAGAARLVAALIRGTHPPRES